MTLRFTLQMVEAPFDAEWLAVALSRRPEHVRALTVPCWLCNAPAGSNCPDDPDDPEIVYQWPEGPLVVFHECRPLT